jgi:hypothetical protein
LGWERSGASAHFKYDGFGNRFCFTRGYFNEDSSAVAMVRQHYGESGIKIVSENAALYVSYVSSHSRKRIKEEFQIIAAYFKSPAPECARKASAAKDE